MSVSQTPLDSEAADLYAARGTSSEGTRIVVARPQTQNSQDDSVNDTATIVR